ncbi:MAG TPA: hypothetical protein VF665_02940 [Longimicrobium sp.]|jgi:hypothetical protein|uniref:hypothetical protein n=1 Tax=Longimicrobium sp. TaxID=2029185 RepID=UPI002ED9BD55
MERRLITAMLRRVLIVLVVTAYPRPAHGQEGDSALLARFRNDCRLAEQILRTGHPDPHREWALAYISRCESAGPVTLAALWRDISAPDEIEPLVNSSLQIRDARLYQQLRRTAEDRARPADVRVAALLVLARNTDPRNAIWLSDLIPPDTIDWIPLKLGWGTGPRQLMGDAPLTEPIAASVLDLFEGIAANRDTEPTAVWYAAAVLAERLRRDIRRGFAH